MKVKPALLLAVFAATNGDRRVMYFRNEAHPGPVPSAAALEVLDGYFAWRRTPEGEAWAKWTARKPCNRQ